IKADATSLEAAAEITKIEQMIADPNTPPEVAEALKEQLGEMIADVKEAQVSSIAAEHNVTETQAEKIIETVSQIDSLPEATKEAINQALEGNNTTIESIVEAIKADPTSIDAAKTIEQLNQALENADLSPEEIKAIETQIADLQQVQVDTIAAELNIEPEAAKQVIETISKIDNLPEAEQKALSDAGVNVSEISQFLESKDGQNITALVEMLDQPQAMEALKNAGIEVSAIETKLEAVAKEMDIPVETLKESVKTLGEVESVIQDMPDPPKEIESIVEAIKSDPQIMADPAVQEILQDIAVGKEVIAPTTFNILTEAVASAATVQETSNVVRVHVGEPAKLAPMSQQLDSIANQVLKEAPLNQAGQKEAPAKVIAKSVEGLQQFTEKLAQGQPVSEAEVVAALTKADTALAKMDNGPLKTQLEAVRQEVAQQVKQALGPDNQELAKQPGPGGCCGDGPCNCNDKFNAKVDPKHPDFDPNAKIVKVVQTQDGPKTVVKTAEQVYADIKAFERISERADTTRDVSEAGVQKMVEAMEKRFGSDSDMPNVIKAADVFGSCDCGRCFGDAAAPKGHGDTMAPNGFANTVANDVVLGGEKIDTSIRFGDTSSTTNFSSSTADFSSSESSGATFAIDTEKYSFLSDSEKSEMNSIFGGCADCQSDCGTCGTEGETQKAPKKDQGPRAANG
ncbi:MAG: hypothetical protein AAF988_06625, partial [Pseudomonadota bacterium]